MAVFVNSVEAVRRSLREVMATGGRKGKDTMGSGRVAGSMKEILQVRRVTNFFSLSFSPSADS